MSSWNVFRWLRDPSLRLHSRRRPRRVAPVRLRLESLEQRLAPATFIIMDNSDLATDAGSLRFALANLDVGTAANTNTITFASNLAGETIVETVADGGTLAITQGVTITGPTGGVTISGDNAVTVFQVNNGVNAALSGLTVADGNGLMTIGGGGINNLGTLTVSNSTLTGNSAIFGGGIDNAGTLTVNGSTFSGNSGSTGAGIENAGALMVSDSTFSGNTGGVGGAIDNSSSSPVTISDSTLSGNSAGTGSGINNAGGTVTLNGDIVVGNINSSTSSPDDLAGANIDPASSHNVIGADGTNTLTTGGANGNQVNVTVAQAGLSPLGNYGGPTQTMLLQPGSVALNAGQTETGAFDQRGFARPDGTPSDAGAVQDRIAVLNVNTTANTESTSDIALSLRDALQLANGNFQLANMTPQVMAQVSGDPGDIDTINLIPGTYTFKAADYASQGQTADNFWYGPNALPAVSSAVIINGDGAVLLRPSTETDDAADALRFFYVSGGLSGLPAGFLSLNNLTLQGGYAQGGDSETGGGGLGAGGAVFNQGSLVLDGVTLTGNEAQGGSGGVGSSPEGGGIGQDAQGTANGGGFGGPFPRGSGGLGGDGGTAAGGGGGFSANGQAGVAGGAGGGLSGLGGAGTGGTAGDGGGAGSAGTAPGGAFGSGGPANGGGGGVERRRRGQRLAGGGFGGGGANGGGDGGFGRGRRRQRRGRRLWRRRRRRYRRRRRGAWRGCFFHVWIGDGRQLHLQRQHGRRRRRGQRRQRRRRGDLQPRRDRQSYQRHSGFRHGFHRGRRSLQPG